MIQRDPFFFLDVQTALFITSVSLLASFCSHRSATIRIVDSKVFSWNLKCRLSFAFPKFIDPIHTDVFFFFVCSLLKTLILCDRCNVDDWSKRIKKFVLARNCKAAKPRLTEDKRKI